MYSLKGKKKELVFIIISIVFIFQIYLQKHFLIFQYFDELITVFFVLYLGILVINKKIYKQDLCILLLISMVIFLGVVYNICFDIQTNVAPILTDIGNCFKVYIVYLGSSYYVKKIRTPKKIISILSIIINCYVLILFVCAFLHEFGILHMGSDIRYGIKSFQFLVDGAGNLSVLFYSILFILTLNLSMNRSVFQKMIIAMALIVWCLTLRSRAFMYVTIYMMLIYFYTIRKKKIKINLINISLVTMVLFLFGMDQFETYFKNTSARRYLLYDGGIKIFKNYFPYGTGFATYGTDAAYKYYSVLYNEFGFDNLWGMSKSDGQFLHDTYWPAIMAQFGAFGLLVFGYIIYLICKKSLRECVHNEYFKVATLFIIITQVSSSLPTATFFNYITVGIFFMLPLTSLKVE